MEGVGVGDVEMSDADGDETMHDNSQAGAAVVPPGVVSVSGEAPGGVSVADAAVAVAAVVDAAMADAAMADAAVADPAVADPAVAVAVVPPAPVFMPSQLKALPASLVVREYGKLVNQDSFCCVLKKLGLASNAKLPKCCKASGQCPGVPPTVCLQ